MTSSRTMDVWTRISFIRSYYNVKPMKFKLVSVFHLHFCFKKPSYGCLVDKLWKYAVTKTPLLSIFPNNLVSGFHLKQLSLYASVSSKSFPLTSFVAIFCLWRNRSMSPVTIQWTIRSMIGFSLFSSDLFTFRRGKTTDFFPYFHNRANISAS